MTITETSPLIPSFGDADSGRKLEAGYFLRPVSAKRTEVTFELRITHGLPLPGFVRRRVVRGLVNGTLNGLAQYVESGPALV